VFAYAASLLVGEHSKMGVAHVSLLSFRGSAWPQDAQKYLRYVVAHNS
jgi:hypothetical protein